MDYAHMFMQVARQPAAESADVLALPQWSEQDWIELLSRTEPRRVTTSEIVISRGALGRSLYFTVAGEYQVGGAYIGGASLSWLARIPAGSVFGEQSFFDGLPRSANVWAHVDGELLVLPFESYGRFAQEAPALARDLAFALARVLSLRLRSTTVRIR